MFFQKGMLLLAGTTLGIRMMGQMIEWRKAWEATPVDGGLHQNMLWNGWLVVSLLACVVLMVHRQLHNRVGKGAAQTFVKVFLLLGAITLVIIGGAITLVDLNEKIVSGSVALASWGSGRGSLWSLACLGFGEADFSEKLIGVGPDCFAPYLLSLGRAPVITKEGYWGNAIFANAHNEWLNQLINIGILGVCCYGSIFVVALKRYRGIFLGILAIVMYGIQSLVSFQQVLSTPFLFLVLGLCEATCRRAKEMEK